MYIEDTEGPKTNTNQRRMKAEGRGGRVRKSKDLLFVGRSSRLVRAQSLKPASPHPPESNSIKSSKSPYTPPIPSCHCHG